MENYLELISKGESENVEFKKSTASLRDATETLCAFANTRGGHLFIGVDDSGKVVGQNVADDTLKNIANSIALNTEPKLYPSIRKIIIDGRECVFVEIEESPLKPHLAYGRPFIRMGSSTQRINRDQYELMLVQKYNGYGFDFNVEKDAAINDIDEESVYEFAETANAKRNLNINLLASPTEILQKLEMVTEDGITNAALLLFGKEPSKYFEQNFEIKAGVFDADSQYDLIKNEQEFRGNLFYNYRQTLLFLLNSIKKEAIKLEAHTQEKYEIPVNALKEVLVNMIVHRDYRQGIKSTIEVRPSFLMFYNPAHLFTPSITIEGLKTTHPSKPGNKLIAKAFFMYGLFENWGGGTLKVIDEFNKSGLQEPIFSFSDGMFKVEILRRTNNGD